MGVWIETFEQLFSLCLKVSHPAWVCGLKLTNLNKSTEGLVTPCVGVWIETSIFIMEEKKLDVTPCVGVWIETSKEKVNKVSASHTLRGCVD